PAAGTAQRRALHQHIEEEVKTETQLAVSQMCGIAGVSRAGYYRFLEPRQPCPEDLKLRDAMHQVALEWPCSGSRRMALALRDRGWKLGRKRLQRLMREDNLL